MTRSSEDGDGARTTNRAERNGGEAAAERPSFASPPCFMHELDAAYLGYLGPNELTLRLGALLDDLRALVEAERRAFASRSAAARAARERARRRVVETIREIMSRTADDAIHRSLRDMLAVYERRPGGE